MSKLLIALATMSFGTMGIILVAEQEQPRQQGVGGGSQVPSPPSYIIYDPWKPPADWLAKGYVGFYYEDAPPHSKVYYKHKTIDAKSVISPTGGAFFWNVGGKKIGGGDTRK